MSKKKGNKAPKPKPSKEAATEQQPATPSAPSNGSRRRESPKRTGRRGPRPLDPEDDFQAPAKSEAAIGEQLVGEPLFPETPAKKPRQSRLPQMEDAQIEELEGSAENYADLRDQRMELTKEEVGAKDELLGLMKKHGKTSYVHDGYDIKVIVESEKLRVRIKKEE